MSEQDEDARFWATIDEPRTASLDDLVIEVRRIADALERGTRCNERQGDAVCGLSDRHVGYHVTGDGRVHWLDED